ANISHNLRQLRNKLCWSSSGELASPSSRDSSKACGDFSLVPALQVEASHLGKPDWSAHCNKRNKLYQAGRRLPRFVLKSTACPNRYQQAPWKDFHTWGRLVLERENSFSYYIKLRGSMSTCTLVARG